MAQAKYSLSVERAEDKLETLRMLYNDNIHRYSRDMISQEDYVSRRNELEKQISRLEHALFIHNHKNNGYKVEKGAYLNKNLGEDNYGNDI